MSRSVSATTLAALFAQETAESFVILLTIDHDDLSAPIRVNTSGENITSRGDEFLAFPFTIVLPEETEDNTARAKIQIDNIDRSIILAVRSISSAPSALLELIRVDDPDTVEASFPDFKMNKVTYDSKVLSADLSIEDFTGEPYPARVFSPADFPGLF